MKKGFTLVEILVVIAVLSIVGVIVLTIFTQTLRGSNKSQIIGIIKQNGQSVLENMDKTIRGADNVVCPTITTVKTLVVVKNGEYTRFRFFDPIAGSTNGQIQQDFPVQPQPPAPKSDIDLFLANVCTDPMGTDSLLPVQVLTDTNPKTGVSIENGLFTRNRLAGFTDQVTIEFNLKPGVETPQAVAGSIDAVTFRTTIQLR